MAAKIKTPTSPIIDVVKSQSHITDYHGCISFHDTLCRISLAVLHQFCRLRFVFGFVHCPVRVVRRRVDRIELQHRRLQSIHYVMVLSCRNEGRISVVHRVFLFLFKNEFGFSLLNAEELIDIRMHFITKGICERSGNGLRLVTVRSNVNVGRTNQRSHFLSADEPVVEDHVLLNS
jgi:hypothetical protein